MDEKAKILDLAMNLNRIGNWAADGYGLRKRRILTFLRQSSEYIRSINLLFLPASLQKTFRRFCKEYQELEKEGKMGPKDELLWAERMMTWGNILTHRTKIIR